MPDTDVYKESDTHVPNPTDQVGTMDTSGTAGAAHSRLEEVTPVFAIADAENAKVAAAALDPNRPDIPEFLVTMPPGQNLVPVDTEAINERIRAKGEAAEETPVVVGGPTPAQQAAAEEGTAKAAAAEAERTQPAAMSPAPPKSAAPSPAPGTQPPAPGTQP